MKVIFIFCEGPHDISFLKVVLGLDKENFKIYKNKLSKYPTPLDEFYKMRLNEYTSLDLRFDEPIYPLLPSLTFTNKNEDTFLIFYNTGGKDKYDKIKIELNKIKGSLAKRIEDLKIEFGEDQDFISSFGFLFVYDADDDGIQTRFKDFKDNLLASISTESINLQPNQWDEANKIGCYIFAREKEEKGALEDILIPLIKESERFKKAQEFINDQKKDKDKVNKNQNKINKASITVAGQFLEPGSAMTVILESKEFLDSDTVTKNQQCIDVAKFFKDALG